MTPATTTSSTSLAVKTEVPDSAGKPAAKATTTVDAAGVTVSTVNLDSTDELLLPAASVAVTVYT